MTTKQSHAKVQRLPRFAFNPMRVAVCMVVNMPRLIVALIAIVLSASTSCAFGQATAPEDSLNGIVCRQWCFDRWNDREGWTVPPQLTGAVHGGSMWLTLRTPLQPEDTGAVLKQTYPETPLRIDSPAGLNIPADRARKVCIRLLNRSSETDGMLWWRTTDAPDKDAGAVRFAMKPYASGWQEVVCHVDGRWKGTIDRIGVTPGAMFRRGEVWIDRIAITDGPARPAILRPDVCSERVVPRICLPGIAQSDFAEAFKVLDECVVVDVPVAGFEHPFMAPGGAYGENWWQLDGSLNLAGAKWVDQAFAEGVIRGFIGVQSQNPDGRIDLWGGAPARGGPADLSSLPRYFEAAYDIARRSGDTSLRERTYQSMRAYLDWWISPVKRDRKTGLITAIAEETFGGELSASPIIGPLTPQAVAPMDLNVAVIVGCRNVAELARRLGHAEDAKRYEGLLVELREAVERSMWDDARGIYCSYDVVKGERLPQLICTTFDAFLLGRSQPERTTKLLAKLTDPALFNWGGVCLTSVARTDPSYVEAAGPYSPRAWFGDIWTMRNMPVIAGLEQIGRHDLAAELAWRTVRIFNRNWTEYVKTSDGTGQGVARYGWSASQYIQSVIEHLFGVDYDCMESRLRIFPHVPKELADKPLRLDGLILPTDGGTRLNVAIAPSVGGEHRISITLDGPIPAGMTEVWLAVASGSPAPVATDVATGQELPVIRDAAMPGAVGIRVPTQQTLEIGWKSASQ